MDAQQQQQPQPTGMTIEQQIQQLQNIVTQQAQQIQQQQQQIQQQMEQKQQRPTEAQQQAAESEINHDHANYNCNQRRTTADQKFSGRTDNYRMWKSHVGMNLQVDSGCWKNVYAQIVWVRGLLEGDAAAIAHGWFERYVQAVAEDSTRRSRGWKEMWEELDKFFAGRFDQSRRIQEYRRTKQGNRSHAEYFQEWESKRNAANVDGDAATLLADYLSGMNQKLRDYVQAQVDSQLRDWEGYIALIHRMAEGWESNHSYSSNESRGRWQSNRGSQPNKQKTTSSGGDAMDLDTTPLWHGKRAKWVNEAEIKKRRDNNLCLRCGGNHFVRACPLLPAQPPSGGRTHIASGQRVTVPEGAWEDEQGKGQL